MPNLQTYSKAMEGKATFSTTLAGPTVPSTGELKAVGRDGLEDTIAQSGFGHCNHGAGPTGGHSTPWTCSMSLPALLGLVCLAPVTWMRTHDGFGCWGPSRALQKHSSSWAQNPQRNPEAMFALQGQGLLSLNRILAPRDEFLHSQMSCCVSHPTTFAFLTQITRC